MTHEELIESVTTEYSSMGHETRVAFFSRILSLFGPYVRDNGQFWLDIYDTAENSGVHILPVHYYSPIPETSTYPAAGIPPLLFGKNFGVDIPPKFQDEFFYTICKFAEELNDIPFDVSEKEGIRWDNGMFGVMDSSVYYAMVRQFKPSTILEIGSGFSTLFASKAAIKNGSTLVECIEPYPVEFFNRHLIGMKQISLTVEIVQNLPLERFSKLKPNDMLFIDSSHVVKSGSDVEYLIFKVLPSLPSGVIVHFHDIFLPFNYPRSNLEDQKRFWNENYILGAFLSNNSSWDVLVSNWTLSTEENLNALCGLIAGGDAALARQLYSISPGGSLWIQKS